MKPKPPSIDVDTLGSSFSAIRPKHFPQGSKDTGISRGDVPPSPLGQVSEVDSSNAKRWKGAFLAKTNDAPHEGRLIGFPFYWIALSTQPAHIYRKTPEETHHGSLESNAICITEPGTQIDYELHDATPSFHFYLSPEIVREVALEKFDVDIDKLSILQVFGERNENLKSLLYLMSNLLNEPQRLSQLKADYVSRAIAAEILSSFGTHASVHRQAARIPSLSPAELRLVTEFIEANMHQDIDIADLAAVCGVGKTAFHQRFKASVQATPYQYVMQARIRRAKWLIAQTQLPLVEIAISCGFSDQAHLTNVFRRMVGMSPAAFRRSAL